MVLRRGYKAAINEIFRKASDAVAAQLRQRAIGVNVMHKAAQLGWREGVRAPLRPRRFRRGDRTGMRPALQ